METNDRKSTVWSTGLAMFAMFFGAGNIVFPLALGQFTQDKNVFGILGLVITAILVPLIGLLAMLLFEGDYTSFFKRIGKFPGFLVTVLILGVIGPLGGIPRCIAISYSTLDAFGLGTIKGVNLPVFSLISCLLIYLFTYRPNKILALLGYVLTPILLLSLAMIVFKGIFTMPSANPSEYSGWQTFTQGLLDGYNTMDLLAAFFFSSVVLFGLRRGGNAVREVPIQENRQILTIAIVGSLIAAVLLACVYISFSYLAAGYSDDLREISSDQLLGTLAYKLLGPYAGMIAGVVVSFACLTTEIALTAVFAQFLRKTLLKEKISYPLALMITLLAAFLVSTLHFEGISAFLVPLLQVCYPALIILSLLNILHKTYGFKPVKSIFYGTLGATLIVQLLT